MFGKNTRNLMNNENDKVMIYHFRQNPSKDANWQEKESQCYFSNSTPKGIFWHYNHITSTPFSYIAIQERDFNDQWHAI